MPTVVVPLIAAGVLAIVAVILLRLGEGGDAMLDRTSRHRIRERLAGLDRSPRRQPVPAHATNARTDHSPHRRLGRDTSALLVLFGAAMLLVLAFTQTLAPTGAVLGDTSAPREVAIAPPVESGATARPSASVLASGTPSPEATSPAPAGSATSSPAGATAAPTGQPDPTPLTTTGSGDRMAVLRACPGRSDCYVYVVRRGDNLVSIANWFGIPFAEVLRRNPQLKDPSRLRAGDRITLPTPRR